MKTNFSNHLGYYIQEAARKSALLLNVELESQGITFAQFRVLNCLWKRGALSQKEILKIISVTPPTLTGIVNILENKKLVYRKSDSEDARTKKIYLTELGGNLQKDTWGIVENFEAKTTGFLTKEEKEILLNGLKQMDKYL